MGKKDLDFSDLRLILKVTPAKFWPKKACLLPISWTKWWILAKHYLMIIILTLFQGDNIFGMYGSLTYGSQLQ